MSKRGDWRDRARGFCERFGGQVPLLLAPMAGACPPALSAAVMRAGGWGAAGALLMPPEEMARWCAAVREASDGPFQLNLWIPEPEVRANAGEIAAQIAFLSHWTGEVGDPAPVGGPDFASQCDALIEARPAAISSMMGVYPPAFVERMKANGIAWFATATTLDEARIAADAGADVIVAQGAEAGGHRGSFDPAASERDQCGLFALLPAIVDAVDVPVVATGGIADARGAAAAFMLGASAVQIGTGFLRADESDAASAWKDALSAAQPGDTMLTRAYTGRCGRALATQYAIAAASPDAPPPAPHPIQRGLTKPMTRNAKASNDISRMQAWAGQSARLARSGDAAGVARAIWQETLELIG
ncbi:MAG: nitronate monooxygenase [Sphingomonadales bacterium]|nr:nitronate monooxygenase [Sphingomonadales bacterium]MDE2569756.1 nitronate monooxygenase [Sphingomonadales bacterium]